MSSVKPELRTDRRKVDGTCPISLRVIVGGRSTRIGTGIAIHDKFWNPKKRQVRSSHDLASTYNAKLTDLTNEALKRAIDAPSAKAVGLAMRTGAGQIASDIDSFIAVQEAREKLWSVRHYSGLRQKITDCFGETMTWGQLDARELLKLESRLRKDDGNSDNTIRKQMKRLRRVYREAVKNGAAKLGSDPFAAYQIPPETRPSKVRLTRTQLQSIESLSFPSSSPLGLARDAFLFSVYTAGMRFGDLCSLTKANLVGERIEYTMAKTGKSVSLPLHPKADAILTRYSGNGPCLFPLVHEKHLKNSMTRSKRIHSRNATINRNLKKVAKAAGVEPSGFSMHVARHTFADLARQSSSDLHALRSILAHSTLNQTQQYLADFDVSATDQLLSDVIG